MNAKVRVGLAVIAALLSAECADAQISALTPICPAGQAPVIESSDELVGLAPATESRGRVVTAVERRQALAYAALLRKHFLAPAPHGPLPVLAGTQPAGVGNAMSRTLGSNVLVILRPDGRLERLAWEYLPLAEPLASALEQAAQDAAASREFADSVTRWGAARLDTVALELRASTRDAEIAEPLMYVRIPAYRGDRLPRTVRIEPIRYPERAQGTGVEARIEADYVVGSDGKAIPETFRFTRGRTEFRWSVRQAILRAEYQAGTSGGCSVPTTVRQAVEFRLAPE